LKLSWYQDVAKGHLTALPSCVLYVNPAKGYTVSYSEGRFMDGTLLSRDETTVADINGKGLWYPVRVLHRYYAPGPDRPSGDPDTPTFTLETKIDHVVVDPPFDQKSDFSVRSLGIAQGQRVWQTDANDNRTSLAWDGNSLLPVANSGSPHGP
jgi:hypothetical protein